MWDCWYDMIRVFYRKEKKYSQAKIQNFPWNIEKFSWSPPSTTHQHVKWRRYNACAKIVTPLSKGRKNETIDRNSALEKTIPREWKVFFFFDTHTLLSIIIEKLDTALVICTWVWNVWHALFPGLGANQENYFRRKSQNSAGNLHLCQA